MKIFERVHPPSNPIEDFRKLISDTKSNIEIHLQNIVDMGSDNAANENKEFDETIENTLFSTSSKELLTIDTDAGNYQNEQISVFKNNPKIQINLKTFNSIESPEATASLKQINRYRKKLRENGAFKAYKSGSRYHKLAPRKYYVRASLKNSSGKTIGFIVAKIS